MEPFYLRWIGPAIRHLRTQIRVNGKKLTAKKVAADAGIRAETLSRLENGVSRHENGVTDPSMSTVLAILEVMGKNLSDLQEAMDEIQTQARVEPMAFELESAPEPATYDDEPVSDLLSLENPSVREGARFMLDLMTGGGTRPSKVPGVQQIIEKLDRIDARVASLEAADDSEDTKPNGTNGQH